MKRDIGFTQVAHFAPLQLGFRMFATKPVFSEANLHLDKHKMERFLQMGAFNMLSAYGPITYLPCPVLVFREEHPAGGGEADAPGTFTQLHHIHKAKLRLVATGTLSSVDPDRIVLKKVCTFMYLLK
jgi:pre-rRNA-processing protein TSR1